MTRARGLLVVLVVGAAAGCAGDTDAAAPGPGLPAATTSTSGAGSPPSTNVTATSTPGVAPGPRFTVETIDAATAARMAASWRPGCPVPLEALRLATVTHWGFDGTQRAGELVVHADDAAGTVSVFRRLHEIGFPIEQIRLVDEFGGDDDRSMAANNTSAFNCRRATGSARWSEHAYGRAIDIDPVQNPYVTAPARSCPPPAPSTPTATPRRSVSSPPTDPVVAAFAEIGWRWGGTWSSSKGQCRSGRRARRAEGRMASDGTPQPRRRRWTSWPG